MSLESCRSGSSAGQAFKSWPATGSEAISRRLRELDREWNIERVTMLSATVDAFATLGLGWWRGRRWLLGGLAFLGSAMLAHVIVGQCPSPPLYRRLGFRTRDEIDYERYALKLVRGDFQVRSRWLHACTPRSSPTLRRRRATASDRSLEEARRRHTVMTCGAALNGRTPAADQNTSRRGAGNDAGSVAGTRR
ncbi:MAG: hypothetical protein JWN44_301 [Myxococcales bacterium]|nr:hypothetical protein [Myxococcales bacterium]